MQLRPLRRPGFSASNRAGKRASISVELALTSVFVLLPLTAGCADMVELISANSQLNTALRAFYAFAWNNPNAVGDIGQLSGILAQINQHSLPRVTFPDGKADTSTTYQPAISYGCIVPPAAPVFQSTPCPAADVQETLVTYSVISTVALPVPLPFGQGNPTVLTVSGQVQAQ
jgi:hypothetical protein